MLSSGGTVCNCLFHPSVRISVHEDFKEEVKKELEWCSSHLNNGFKAYFEKAWSTFSPAKSEKKPLEELFVFASELLNDPEKIKVLIMNGRS